MSYDYFKFLTSKIEVEVKAEVKIEVISGKGISISTSIQNFEVLALKMTELWLFKFLTSKIEVEVKAEIKIQVISG